MSTFRELIYMVADLSKQVSDDDTLNYNHIAFLLKKYRSYLLKQKYAKTSKVIPQSNYQTVCANMKLVENGAKCVYNDCLGSGSGDMLRSVSDIGEVLSFADTEISIFKCPGEYSLKLNILTTDFEKPNEITSQQVKYINSIFSCEYPFLIPTFDSSSGDWAVYEGNKYSYTPEYNLYRFDEDGQGPYSCQCIFFYNPENDTYVIHSVDCGDEYLPVWYSSSSESNEPIYLTNCSDDVDIIIGLLNRNGIDAVEEKIKDGKGECNEDTFYTDAIKKYGNISVTPTDAFAYAGLSKYNRGSIFGTLGIDNHLYVKSNRDLKDYDRALITSMFEDPEDAYSKSSCTYKYKKWDEQEQQYVEVTTRCPQGGACDPWDMQFPIEDALQPALISMTVKDIVGAAWRPQDNVNDAADNLANIETFVRRNMKQQYVNQQQPSDVE